MRRWTGTFSVIVALGLVAGLTAAGQFPVTVVDDRGHEITIPARPERIVVAGTALYVEILLDIGAGERLVGVTDSEDNPPEVADLPRVGKSYSPSVEAILALQPDLVLGAWGEIRAKLEEVGIIVLTTGRSGGYITSLPDIFVTIRTVGTAVGNLVRADGLIGKIAEQVVRVESAVLGLQPVPTAFLYMSAPDTPPYAAGAGSIENELILRAGGSNVFAEVSGFPPVSLEEVLARDPQVVFTDPAYVNNVLQSELLQEIAAVAEQRVFGIASSATTSTRVAATLQAMAEFLHPEAFEGS